MSLHETEPLRLIGETSSKEVWYSVTGVKITSPSSELIKTYFSYTSILSLKDISSKEVICTHKISLVP